MSHPPFTISRLLRAPRQLVWEVYSQPEHLPHWFGPKGSRMPHSALDFRVGGSFHYAMQTEQGMALWGKWLLREIVEPEKIVLIQHFSDAQGGVTRNPWAPQWPLYTLSTTTLREQDGGTLLTLAWAPYEATAEESALFGASHDSMRQGWGGNLDVLEGYLAELGAREIRITRTVRAPRERVWDAMTDPAQVVHWWGPNRFSTEIEHMDVRVGGAWRHTMVGPDGARYPNQSVFRAVERPARLVYAHGGGKEGGPGASFVATWTFEQVAEGTRVTIRMLFPDAQARDFVATEFGAIEGGQQTLARLDGYLQTAPR